MIDPVIGKWDGDEKSKSRAKWRAGLGGAAKGRDYKRVFGEVKYLLSAVHIFFPAYRIFMGTPSQRSALGAVDNSWEAIKKSRKTV